MSLFELLEQCSNSFVGSEQMYFYDIKSGAIGKTPFINGKTGCNGLLAYRAAEARGRRYIDDKKTGEEPAFLKGDMVAQYPEPQHIHMMLIHPNNTVTKRNYLIDPRCKTNLTLDDLPMLEVDKVFYRQLTQKYTA